MKLHRYTWVRYELQDELPKEHVAVSLEEIRAIALAPVKATRERRIRSAVLWWLCGIRI